MATTTSTNDLTPAEMLMGARRAATKAAPYLSRALYAMTYVAEPRLPTVAVDEHWRMYYNPDYVVKCAGEGTLVGEVLHEVLHPTLRHGPRAVRCCADDRAYWNRCADAELDQQIEAMGNISLVANRIKPEHVHGKPGETAEEYYAHRQPPPPGGEGKGHGKPCGGGSGTGGEPGEWEQGAPSGRAPGLSDAEADLVRTGTAADIRAHAESKGRGNLPAGLLRWADTFADPPPVDWATLAVARVTYHLDAKRGSTPSYARPSRRQVRGGILLPVYRTAAPTICLVIDTSLSMGNSDIATGLACVADAIGALGKLSVVACDSAATDPITIRHIDDLREHLTGGGGTNMCAGIRNAEECRPDAIVVVTDGDTPWPSAPPETPVTVVLTRQSSVTPPEWAEVIEAFR